MHYRIMIATIRDFGLYPCPRCLIQKEDISKIGTDDDRRAREELRRSDTVERRDRVEQARENLYVHGYALTGDYVDGFLKEGSMVPTKVIVAGHALTTSATHHSSRTHSHRSCRSLGLTSSRFSQWICCTTSSWGRGKMSSPI